jgi:hypothetical protein
LNIKVLPCQNIRSSLKIQRLLTGVVLRIVVLMLNIKSNDKRQHCLDCHSSNERGYKLEECEVAKAQTHLGCEYTHTLEPRASGCKISASANASRADIAADWAKIQMEPNSNDRVWRFQFVCG